MINNLKLAEIQKDVSGINKKLTSLMDIVNSHSAREKHKRIIRKRRLKMIGTLIRIVVYGIMSIGSLGVVIYNIF